MKMNMSRTMLVLLAILFSATNSLAKSSPANDGAYTAKDKEYYLTAEQINFIRPGLKLEILDVVIPDDLQPEVTFRITDPAGLGLDRDGVTTPGPVSTSFILASIPQGEEAYVAYTTRVQTSPITGDSFEQASSDRGGTYTDMGDGQYMYKFATLLPADYDADATHTLGVYARRDLREWDLDRYVDNGLKHFVPSGMSAPTPRDIVTTETCNGRCHNPLAEHGGARQEVGLCVLCHNPSQGIDPDTGNSVDFKSMIHKIHAGGELDTPLVIVGFRQGVHDYSDVEFPAEINDCEVCHTGGTPTEDFPLVASPNPVPVCDNSRLGATNLTWGDIDAFEIHMGSANGPTFARSSGAGSKETGKWVKDGTRFFLVDNKTGNTVQNLAVDTTALGCVSPNQPGTFRGVAGSQHTDWLNHPSRVACGSCHDDVDFASGDGHPGGAQADDENCGFCHKPAPGGDEEFDRSIRGAHKPVYKSRQLPGIIVRILAVTDTDPGDSPTVTFSMQTKNGKLNPASLDFFRLYIAGPNTDYSFLSQEDARGAVKDGDNWSYTFTTPLPLDADGSFTAGAEAYEMTPVQLHDELSSFRNTAQNDYMAFAVTDAAPVPRRMVVDDAKCENCHSNLALHGTIRHDAQYCAGCHQPGATDESQIAEGATPQSINFKFMIHKIHRGENLENGFVVAGFRGSIHDFSDVAFPGDLRDCATCHVNDSYELPLPAGLLATTTPQELFDPMMPAAAACLSCHDDDAAAAHAFSNTTFFGEACAACHGEDAEFAVEKVHAR